MISFGVFKYK